jgi:hypothetical protein
MPHARSEYTAHAGLVAGAAVAVRLPRQRAARRVVTVADILPAALALAGALIFAATFIR